MNDKIIDALYKIKDETERKLKEAHEHGNMYDIFGMVRYSMGVNDCITAALEAKIEILKDKGILLEHELFEGENK